MAELVTCPICEGLKTVAIRKGTVWAGGFPCAACKGQGEYDPAAPVNRKSGAETWGARIAFITSVRKKRDDGSWVVGRS